MILRLTLSLISSVLFFFSCRENKNNTINTLANSNVENKLLDSFNLDKSQSTIYWEGSSPTSKHNGILKFKEGTLYSSNNILKNLNVSFDMNSISVKDIEDPSDKIDLESHLKSDDFFFADSFPIGNFKMTGITMIHDTVFNAIAHGLLTIKNISKPLQLKCKITHSEDSISIFVPEFSIDRTEYNIMYQSKKILNVLKDGFINDEIKLSIKLVAVKKLGARN